MKLLIFAPYGIGNLILLYPVLKKLKEQNISFDIASFLGSVDYMLREWNEFEDLYDKRWFIGGLKSNVFKTILQIRKEKYTHSVVSFPSAKPHYNILSFLCGAKNRVGSVYPDNNIFKTFSFLNNRLVPVQVGSHDVDQNLLLVQKTGLLSDTPLGSLEKFCSSEIDLIAKDFTLGFHIGCSANSSYKRWPLNKWMHLSKQLKEEYPDYELQFFFGPDEKEELTYFQAADHITIKSGLSLEETKKAISRCRVFISNDSGLMHMASLMNVPNVAIIGPSDERRTGPYSAKAEILSGECEFRPCSHNYHLSSHSFKCHFSEIKCMNSVSPKQIIEKIRMFLPT